MNSLTVPPQLANNRSATGRRSKRAAIAMPGETWVKKRDDVVSSCLQRFRTKRDQQFGDVRGKNRNLMEIASDLLLAMSGDHDSWVDQPVQVLPFKSSSLVEQSVMDGSSDREVGTFDDHEDAFNCLEDLDRESYEELMVAIVEALETEIAEAQTSAEMIAQGFLLPIVVPGFSFEERSDRCWKSAPTSTGSMEEEEALDNFDEPYAEVDDTLYCPSCRLKVMQMHEEAGTLICNCGMVLEIQRFGSVPELKALLARTFDRHFEHGRVLADSGALTAGGVSLQGDRHPNQLECRLVDGCLHACCTICGFYDILGE